MEFAQDARQQRGAVGLAFIRFERKTAGERLQCAGFVELGQHDSRDARAGTRGGGAEEARTKMFVQHDCAVEEVIDADVEHRPVDHPTGALGNLVAAETAQAPA